MSNLFSKSDFALFTEYAGKHQQEAPEGYGKLRSIYDKLGQVAKGLDDLGYHTDINRKPLRQAGQGTMAYSEYHWARVYPKDSDYYNGCKNIIFFVIGTTEKGFNIHIDSYSAKGHYCNDVAEGIKEDIWLELSPQKASQYGCDQMVGICEQYTNNNWIAFNRFGKEFGIKECIDYLKKMDLNSIKQLLLSSHNLILNGAPGTGKTFLAKQIASAIILGQEYSEKVEEDPVFKARCRFVQFHPSYDYTDFVEGLRPVGKDKELGFKRMDGIFKAFCAKAAEDDESNKYVFIIDEINRGEMSKIFGELFFSIDPGYRGKSGMVNTQYQNLVEETPFNDGFLCA